MTIAKCLLAVALLGCCAFAQGKPDFGGTWKLNNGRSTQDGPADRVYISVIQQTPQSLTVTTKAEGVTDELDGTYKVTGKPRIENKAKGLYRYTQASWENATLVLELKDKDGKKDTSKITHYVREGWSLSPDGKTLTKFRRTALAGKPIIDQKYVFDKQ